ncbi:MAG: hypothetical protein K2I46_05910 [Clostridia bacterium]|nr:hypothetical protein [Clostridia bacterium]
MNIKRMEVMIEEVSENLDRHISASLENFYFVLTAVDGESQLSIRLYSQGGNAELEILAFPADGERPSCQISVDGEVVDKREGTITIAPISLSKGWRTVEIIARNLSSGRARIKGSISGATILEN